jgi:hypothetical protein
MGVMMTVAKPTPRLGTGFLLRVSAVVLVNTGENLIKINPMMIWRSLIKSLRLKSPTKKVMM